MTGTDQPGAAHQPDDPLAAVPLAACLQFGRQPRRAAGPAQLKALRSMRALSGSAAAAPHPPRPEREAADPAKHREPVREMPGTRAMMAIRTLA